MAKPLKKSNILVSGFLDYLKKTGQTNLLPDVTRILDNIASNKAKAEEIIVSSAVPLTETQKEQIKQLIYRLFQKKIPLKNKIDKELLGGFVIKVGDWVLDASLLVELNNLKRALLA